MCTIILIAPLNIADADPEKIYYHMTPLIGTGTFYTPVGSSAYMRQVIDRTAAELLISSIPSIAPAICEDTRFNHVDAYYKELFKLHTPEAMVSIIKGLNIRISEKKTKSTRTDATIKRAKEILFGELSVALSMPYEGTEQYVLDCIGASSL